MQIDIFGSFLRKVKDEYRDSVREVESSKKGQHMPSEGIYDNAQWHYKIGFLKKVSKEQGATHIAFFLRWCLENQLVSRSLLDQIQEVSDDLLQGTLSYPAFVIQKMDGVFSRKGLNPTGQVFADVYYTTQENAFSSNLGNYVEDYTALVHVLSRLNGADYSCVKYIDKNYRKVRALLTKSTKLSRSFKKDLLFKATSPDELFSQGA